jgi:branched-chain amino acid transport system permease protein
VDPSLIIGAIVVGLLSGGIYALMSSGLTLIFGVMDIINVAQGALVILGAYLSYWLALHYNLDLFVGLLITMPIMFGLGLFLEFAFIRHLKQDRTLLSILVTFAIALIIEGVLGKVFSTDFVQLNAWYVTQSFQLPLISTYVAYIYVFSSILSVVLLGGLYFLLYRTSFGFALRATMQNRTAAELIGIDVQRISTITFGLGISLAAAGGMAFGAINAFDPGSSYDLISRLLVIIILGGMGSLAGALLASLFMLVVQDVTAVVWSPTWASTVFYIVLAVVLLVRPQGFFGQVETRRQ